jgi:hypothetical protein
MNINKCLQMQSKHKYNSNAHVQDSVESHANEYTLLYTYDVFIIHFYFWSTDMVL